MKRDVLRRAFAAAVNLHQQHGSLWSASILLFHVLRRLLGVTVLSCVHKRVGSQGPCAARQLTRRELEEASRNPALDLPPSFVASPPGGQCYGVVSGREVRSYAWASSEPTPALHRSVVAMPPDTVYVYKAFTDPSFRQRGLLGECLKAIDQHAAREGREEVSALIELHNRSSLRAFRRAGFERCGYVFLLKWPWIARRFGCRCSTPCTWSRRDDAAGAVGRLSSDQAAGLRSSI